MTINRVQSEGRAVIKAGELVLEGNQSDPGWDAAIVEYSARLASFLESLSALVHGGEGGWGGTVVSYRQRIKMTTKRWE